MAHANVAERVRRTRLQNESEEYLAKREELRLAEIEEMRLRERVAEMRRNLPKGAAVPDFEFLDCSADPARNVSMSALFTRADRALVLYQFMYGKQQKEPCPMCTMFIDGLNGVAHHIADNVDLAIVAASSPEALREHARKRGWDKLRLLTTPPGSTFKYDMGSEDEQGVQDSTISVFTMEPTGTIRHFYTAHPSMAPDIRERGIDLLCAVYNVLDLTPKGRGDWYAQLDYSRQP
jgi:predicted dithiol-disulfide oxidoreductase (DUF899 family)